MSEELILLHLSDIHFGKPGSSGFYDLDGQLRNEIELDLGRLRTLLGTSRGILITGDIAYSGKKDQYQKAVEWLKKITKIVGCDEDDVWSVPGNHDVDRTVIKNSNLLRIWHERMREKCNTQSQIDEELVSASEDQVCVRAVSDAMLQYIDEFAHKFGCYVDLKKPTWSDDLLLNDGSKLRLHGLTSTFISNDLDDYKSKNRMVLGTAQVDIKRELGVENLVLCHHPPQWLIDEDFVETKLKALFRIQLFGHKHSQNLEQIGKALRLSAGAVHPDRKDLDWTPRYNVLSLKVEENNGRFLHVEVWPRIWNSQSSKFVPEYGEGGKEYREYNLELDPWTRPEIVQEAEEKGVSTAAVALQSSSMKKARINTRHYRKLVYSFFSLPIHQRVAILSRLNLIPDEASESIDNRTFDSALLSAKKRQLLDKIWDAVVPGEPNPFSGSKGV